MKNNVSGDGRGEKLRNRRQRKGIQVKVSLLPNQFTVKWSRTK